jgi:hypothetical protein
MARSLRPWALPRSRDEPDNTPKSNSTEHLLSVRGVTVRFGGIVAVDGVT